MIFRYIRGLTLSSFDTEKLMKSRFRSIKCTHAGYDNAGPRLCCDDII